MSESTNLLTDAATRIFRDQCDKQLLDAAERGEFAQPLWALLGDNGFLETGCTAEVSAQDLYALIGLAGEYVLPVPFVENVLVGRWLSEPSGHDVVSVGVISDNRICDVPWGRAATRVVGIDAKSSAIVVVANPQVLHTGVNIAGEARDVIALPDAVAPVTITAQPFLDQAAGRVCLIAGVLRAVLEISLRYATEREQFGRPISKFQAIQHNLAVLAAEVAAAQRAADAAVDARDGERYGFEVAAAKARASEAVTIVAELAHQVHGAMGFTHEHILHHLTRRAWAWRDEYGGEALWQDRLGTHIAQLGADAVWNFVATPA